MYRRASYCLTRLTLVKVNRLSTVISPVRPMARITSSIPAFVTAPLDSSRTRFVQASRALSSLAKVKRDQCLRKQVTEIRRASAAFDVDEYVRGDEDVARFDAAA